MQTMGEKQVVDPYGIKEFEEFLLQNLRSCDTVTQEGSTIFNVNQAAYLVENGITGHEKRTTRRRVSSGLEFIPHVIRRTNPSNKGVPFANIEAMYSLVIHHLKGSTADKMREESNIVFSRGVKQGCEDEMAEHLLAWAQCNFIPMFSNRNQKVFDGCNFRPDFVWCLPEISVILECDKHAHDNIDKQKESDRMHDIMQACGFSQTVFIRFNPSLRGSTTQLKFATLQSVLLDVFAKKDEYIATKGHLVYLFYPDVPSIWYPPLTLAGTKHPRDQVEEEKEQKQKNVRENV